MHKEYEVDQITNSAVSVLEKSKKYLSDVVQIRSVLEAEPLLLNGRLIRKEINGVISQIEGRKKELQEEINDVSFGTASLWQQETSLHLTLNALSDVICALENIIFVRKNGSDISEQKKSVDTVHQVISTEKL